MQNADRATRVVTLRDFLGLTVIFSIVGGLLEAAARFLLPVSGLTSPTEKACLDESGILWAAPLALYRGPLLRYDVLMPRDAASVYDAGGGAREANGDDHWTRGHLAQLECEDGNLDEAVKLYEQILAVEPKAAWAKVELAQVVAEADCSVTVVRAAPDPARV